jgi:hypothetical protein
VVTIMAACEPRAWAHSEFSCYVDPLDPDKYFVLTHAAIVRWAANLVRWLCICAELKLQVDEVPTVSLQRPPLKTFAEEFGLRLQSRKKTVAPAPVSPLEAAMLLYLANGGPGSMGPSPIRSPSPPVGQGDGIRDFVDYCCFGEQDADYVLNAFLEESFSHFDPLLGPGITADFLHDRLFLKWGQSMTVMRNISRFKKHLKRSF